MRTDRPLVDLRTSARRQVLLTNLASVVFGFAMFAMSPTVPHSPCSRRASRSAPPAW